MKVAELPNRLRRNQRRVARENNDVVISLQRFPRHDQGVASASLLRLQDEIHAGMRHRGPHAIGLVSDDRVDILRRYNANGGRITCSSRDFPPTSCNTLGSCDFSLVPLPAAIMATATRGSTASAADVCRPCAALMEELPFDFFIRPNIPCPRGNGYFSRGSLESFSGATDSPIAAAYELSRGRHAQVRH